MRLLNVENVAINCLYSCDLANNNNNNVLQSFSFGRTVPADTM